MKCIGDIIDHLNNIFFEKLGIYFEKVKNVKFILYLQITIKLKNEIFYQHKGQNSSSYQLSVVYKFFCPSWSSSYIGRVDRALYERTEEHAFCNKNIKNRSAAYENNNHLFNMFCVSI